MAKPIELLAEIGPLLDERKSGVGYYLDGFVRALCEIDGVRVSGFYFDFLSRRGFVPPDIDHLRYLKIQYFPERLIVLLKRFGLSPILGPVVARNADAYFFSNYVSLPTIKRLPVVLAVYDLGYMDVPKLMQESTLAYLRDRASRSIESADLIITISEFTKGRIEHHFPNTRGKIIVTPIPPPKPNSTGGLLPERLQALGKYILFLGTVEPRKNVTALLDAYEQLPAPLRQEYGVVIAGGKGWKDERILARVSSMRQAGVNIVQTGYITDAEKAALYSHASIFVLPSHYEGFGMPVLEAMSYGVPVAISDIQVFREVAGDAAVFFDKDSPADIADKISQLLTDDAVSARLVRKGKAHLERFSWHENALAVRDALRLLLK